MTRVFAGQCGFEISTANDPGHLVDATTAARSGARQHDSSDQRRVLQRNDLRDTSAE